MTDPTPIGPAQQDARTPRAPLCVDLENALVRADFLWEERIASFSRRLLRREHVPPRQWLADQLAAGNPIPHRPDVIDFIRAEQDTGRTLVLLSRLSPEAAQTLARQFDLRPARIIAGPGWNAREVSDAVGPSFDLLTAPGGSSDLSTLARRVHAGSPVARRRRVALFKAARPHQWVKNLLVFVPLILAHKITDGHRIIAAALAFAAMCLCASAVYIFNDLLDIPADRRHPAKRHRPFASCEASIPAGLTLAGVCILGSLALLPALPWRFAGTLGAYFVLTSLYSVWLKRKPLVDVFTLASLYTLRIIAGALAVEVMLTMWLLAFSMFFFLSLAFVKRYAELVQIEHIGGDDPAGRGYRVSDLRIIESIGPASGYLSVLVFCNYLDSPLVRTLYGRPQVLWLVAPLLLYWITRVWLLARRRLMHDDPVVFALRDRTSRICGVIAAIVVLLAWSGWPHF